MIPVRLAVERAFRNESGAVLASLIRVLGDFQLAEDAMHEAFTVALERWPDDGIPHSPAAWITTTARRRALDRIRREATAARKQPDLKRLAELAEEEASAELVEASPIDDDRLRLIFTCCHPALSRSAQVALTLRTLCGLSTEAIAAAFFVPQPTMAQRLVRAKKKIRLAKIPYQVPDRDVLHERLAAVLGVIYLVFNEGYFAREGTEAVVADLCDEGIRLSRLLAELMPDEPEVLGLLALLLLHDSRRQARDRVLEEQDRSLWDQEAIAQGTALIRRALRMGRVGVYQLQAAIAAVHAEATAASDTDWRQIALLYGELARVHPSPIVELNRAVAVSMADGPEAGLSLLERLAEVPELLGYQPYHAARADLLRRAGRTEEAQQAYRRALAGAPNEMARAFLQKRLDQLGEPSRER